MILDILGVISAIVFSIGYIPYFLDIKKGKTKPQRTTWGILFALNLIIFASQVSSGATSSLWFFASTILISGAVFIASIFKGSGGLARLDILTLSGAFFGLGMWIIFDSPLISVLANTLIYLFSAIPTIKKTSLHPEQETKITWIMGSLSALIALVSVGIPTFELSLLPLSGVLVQGYVAFLTIRPTQKK